MNMVSLFSGDIQAWIFILVLGNFFWYDNHSYRKLYTFKYNHYYQVFQWNILNFEPVNNEKYIPNK